MNESDSSKKDYTAWSQTQLIERVIQLENELRARTSSILPSYNNSSKEINQKKQRTPNKFDPSKYSTRLVAFKLAYLGKRYNGFEHHAGQRTPLPTIEEELWKALTKGKLIFPAGDQQVGDWEGCEYSKCGRTDKGVSAFGQVIGLRMRSNRPLSKKKSRVEDAEGEHDVTRVMYETERDSFNTHPRENALELGSPPLNPSLIQRIPSEELQLSDTDYEEALNFDSIKDEISYLAILNKLLPPDIRILAWCPSPPIDFSARFSCRERRYKYFFTQPAFLPTPNHFDPHHAQKSVSGVKDGWLDIEAMNQAAKMYEGLHDFRNFCKVDGSKQITNFERRIFKAVIEEVPDATQAMGFLNGDAFTLQNHEGGAPKVYTFTLHGSAFLWHQVRHMVAILFLVGQGLEAPSLVTELLDTEKNPQRPIYEMASDTPLVLWNCVFPHESDVERKDALDWLYAGNAEGQADGKYGVPTGGLMDDLWRVWHERKVDEVLASNLLGMVAAQGEDVESLNLRELKGGGGRSQRVYEGGDGPRLKGNYEKVMRKGRMATPEVQNERYAVRKGFESSDDLKKQGFRRLNKPVAEADEP